MLIEFLAVIFDAGYFPSFYVYILEFENKTYLMGVTILKMHTFYIKGTEFSMIIKLTSVKSQAD